jgi:uncharacterized membrane protein YkoI
MSRLVKSLLQIITIILSLSMLSTAWSDDDHNEARQLMKQGDILPLETILKKLPHTGGRILEVELEHEHGQPAYEVEILNLNGQVLEYLIDAKTGKLLSVEEED